MIILLSDEARMLEDQLLWKFKRGSSEALERIYDKCESFLVTVATALSHSIDVAEDVVHDFFLSFVASPSRHRIGRSLKAYMVICVANLTRDWLRKKLPEPVASLKEIREEARNAVGPRV